MGLNQGRCPTPRQGKKREGHGQRRLISCVGEGQNPQIKKEEENPKIEEVCMTMVKF
jgi:hypothetical protein